MNVKKLLRSSRFWLAAFALLILVSSLMVLFFARSAGGTGAVITQDGVEIQRIDLGEVRDEYTFSIEAPTGGYNTILVERGAISVVDASCPDHVCINTGSISNSLRPIVCLPNRLMIEIENAADPSGVDTVSG